MRPQHEQLKAIMKYPTELLEKAKWEMKVFERCSAQTCEELVRELQRLRSENAETSAPTTPSLLTEKQLFDLLPTVQFKDEKPSPMVWLTRKDAYAFATAAIKASYGHAPAENKPNTTKASS